MTKGSKVWFWVVLIVNILSALSGFMIMSSMPKLAVMSIISGVGLAVGAGIILFRQKKYGLYVIIGMAILNCLYMVVNKANIVFAVLSAVLNPLISYYFVNKNADVIK